MGIMSLRQDATVATNIVELAKDHLDPKLRRAIDAHFAAQSLREPLTAEYVQGLFSGMYLAQNWLRMKKHDDEAIGLITGLTIELARKYVEHIEAAVAAKSTIVPKAQ